MRSSGGGGGRYSGGCAGRPACAGLRGNQQLGGGTKNASTFGDYDTSDAVFDVNGIVSTGREQIEALYASTEDEPDNVTNKGVFHVVLSNPVIEVEGDKATARFLWTGISNPDPKAPPQVAEHGREYDKRVKQEGKWLIAKRVVIADSALPEWYAATYKPRLDYDIGAE